MSATTLDEMLRRAIELNFRYYVSCARITADYLRDMVDVVSSGNLRHVHSPPQAQPFPGRTGTAPVRQHATASMVLEAEAGRVAIGAFLVENHLDHDVKNFAIMATDLIHPSGTPVPAVFIFEPPQVTLGAREQVLVRVGVTIPESLEAETRYAGEITIPELKGTRIPILVRRRLSGV